MLRNDEPLEILLSRLKARVDVETDFAQLFLRYHDRIYRSFPALRVTYQIRRELTQDVLLKVYKSMERCPTQAGDFERWLYKIARNTYLTWVESRQRAKRHGQEVDLGEMVANLIPSREPTPLDEMLLRERRERLWQAIGELPPQMRRCVQFRAGHSLTAPEIAGILGLATGTVKAHLHRAQALLREKLLGCFQGLELEDEDQNEDKTA